MAQGWRGNPEGHARAGRLGGKKSAEKRRLRNQQFGERISSNTNSSASQARRGQRGK